MAPDLYRDTLVGFVWSIIFYVWDKSHEINDARIARRIAAGRPSVAERLGWWVASLTVSRSDRHRRNLGRRK